MSGDAYSTVVIPDERRLIRPRVVHPCESTAQTKTKCKVAEHGKLIDDASTHPLGNQVETEDERGLQIEIDKGKKLGIFEVREN